MAESQDTYQFLTYVPLFQGLKNRQLKKLAKRFVTRDFETGTPIVSQGRGGAGLFILTAGKAQVVFEGADDEKVLVNTLGPSDFFGEIALLDDGPRTASVIATEPTECLVLSRPDFISVLQNDAKMGITIAQELASRSRKTVDALERTHHHGGEEEEAD